MSRVDRVANVLGALSLVISDRTEQSVAAEHGLSESTAAALSALKEFLGDPSLDQLGRVLGLTPSGAVRLVDRMAEQGLVTRGPGLDGRSRAVSLTKSGRRTAARLAATRARVLGASLSGLDPRQLEALEDLMTRIMTTVVEDKDGGAWICRLCDFKACGRPAGRCPAQRAAAAKAAAAGMTEVTSSEEN